MENTLFEFIKIEKDVNASDSAVQQEVIRLMKFIYQRSKSNKDTYYIVLSYTKGGKYSSYIVLAGNNEERLRYEADLIRDFIKSNMQYIDATIKKVSPRNTKALVPLPALGLFFREQRNLIMINPFFIEDTVKYPKQRIIEPSQILFVQPRSEAREKNMLIPIGRPIESLESRYVGIPFNYLFQHIVILGASGSGKTTTGSIIVNNLLETLEGSLQHKLRIVIIDWHGEYHHLIHKYKLLMPGVNISVNPFAKYGSIDLLHVFEDTLDLTEPQSYLLHKLLVRDPPKTLSQLIEKIESIEETSSWIREVKLALLRKLAPIQREHKLFREDLLTRYLSNIRGCPLIIDTSRIQSIIARKLFVLFLLKEILTYQTTYTGNSMTIVLIDEAHNVFSKNMSSFLIKFVSEVRKRNIGIISITQSPSNINENIMVNSATKIIHAIRSSQDIDVIKKITKLPEALERLLPVLNPGEAILYTPLYKYPIIISVEKVR